MAGDDAYRSPQEQAGAAEAHWLRGMAKVSLAIGSACSLIGIGLVAGGICMLFGRIARSGVVLTEEEVVDGIVAGSWLFRIGAPAALFGLLAILFGGILWIPLRKARCGNRREF